MKNAAKARIGLLVVMLFSAVSVLTPVYSQNDADEGWYYGQTIRRIDFQGLDNIKRNDVDSVTRQFIGKAFSDELYEDLLNRIDALEFFDDVSSEILPLSNRNTTIHIRFTVTERPIVDKVTFIGNRKVRTTEIKEAIVLKEKDVFQSGRVTADERAIRDLYLKKGYTQVRVSSGTAAGKTGIDVTFTIDEGSSTVVTAVSFQGNSLVQERVLKRQIATKESTLIKKGYFQEAALEQDRQALLAYYQNMGYVDAEVTDVSRKTSYNEKSGQNEMEILFTISEGLQYTFGGITFQGNHIFSTDNLKALMFLKEGAIFNQARFQSGIQAVIDRYHENGYTSNSFTPQVDKNDTTRVISCAFTIEERQRSHIENVIVRGNDKTKDSVITRELPLESGDIFSKAKVTSGLRNLFNLQFFSAIVPDVVPGSEENLVDLIINVEEQSTTSIELGLTFAGVTDPNDFPISLFVKLQDSNLRGTGKSGSVDTTLSPDQQSLSLGYGDSWLWGMPVSVSLSGDVNHRRLTTLQNMYFPGGGVDNSSYYMNYEQWSFAISGGLGRRWYPNFAIFVLQGGATFRFIQNIYDYDLFEPYDSTIARYKGMFHPQNTVYTSAYLDDRDINYDPSKGWFLKQRFAWTGLLPFDIGLLPKEEEFFLRSDTQAEAYLTLFDIPVSEKWNLKWVLADLATASFLVDSDSTANSGKGTIGETSQLYIDGMFNGRGWGSLYLTNRGKTLLYNATELRMPVVPGFLSLDFFFDAIAVKDRPSLNRADGLDTLSLDDIYFSFGPGLRFSIAQFPLRFLFANTFQIIDGKTEWRNGKGPEWQFVLSFNITNR